MKRYLSHGLKTVTRETSLSFHKSPVSIHHIVGRREALRVTFCALGLMLTPHYPDYRRSVYIATDNIRKGQIGLTVPISV